MKFASTKRKLIVMQNAISTTAEVQNFVVANQRANVKTAQGNIFSKFINWCKQQEDSRMLWLVVACLVQIGAALPCTLTAIYFWGDNSFALWAFVCVVNVPVLAIALAAQPTKILIPVLVSAWTINMMVILYCLSSFYLHF